MALEKNEAKAVNQSVDGLGLYRLVQPIACWHESMSTARVERLMELGQHGGFIESERPLPVGTKIYIEPKLEASPETVPFGLHASVMGTGHQTGAHQHKGFYFRFEEVSATDRRILQQFLSTPGRCVLKAASTTAPQPEQHSLKPALVVGPTSAPNPTPDHQTAQTAPCVHPGGASTVRHTLPYGVERQTLSQGAQGQNHHHGALPPAPTPVAPIPVRGASRPSDSASGLHLNRPNPGSSNENAGVFSETMEFGTDELMAAMQDRGSTSETNAWIAATESPTWPLPPTPHAPKTDDGSIPPASHSSPAAPTIVREQPKKSIQTDQKAAETAPSPSSGPQGNSWPHS